MRDARPMRDGAECTLALASSLAFDPVPPTELAAMRAEPEPRMPAGEGLITLSLCHRAPDEEELRELAETGTTSFTGKIISKKAILEFAQRRGPLFGRALAEDFAGWGGAVSLASLAVTIQQVINGTLGMGALELQGAPSKRRILNTETDGAFVIYDVLRPCPPEYLRWLGGSAFVRKETGEGRYDYALMIADESDGFVEFFVASFAHEMTMADYWALTASVELDDNVRRQLRERLNLGEDTERSDYQLAGSMALVGEDEDLGEDDYPALGFLVRALISAHLRDAYVDPFQSDEATGYLSFRSYLSWLWFDFSKCLGAVKVGYCEECGKPFSLVGHRGIARRFCSQDCKTKSKNSRMRRRRDEVREGFIAGESMDELVQRLGGDYSRADAEAQVRDWLTTWPRLRHEIDADVAASGTASQLLSRCLEFKLGAKILTPKARHLLGV